MARLLTALLVVSFAACGGGEPASEPAPSGAPPAAATSRELDAYPQPYRTMNLPALPGATLTSSGRQTTSLRDGIVIRLTSPMSVNDVRDYYRQELTSRGWTEQTGQAGRAVEGLALPIARLAFVRDALSYDVTITAESGPTNVQINLIEH